MSTDSLFAKWQAVFEHPLGVLLLFRYITSDSVRFDPLDYPTAHAIRWFIYASMSLYWVSNSVVCRTPGSAGLDLRARRRGRPWLDMLCNSLFIAVNTALRYLVLMQAGFTPPVAAGMRRAAEGAGRR